MVISPPVNRLLVNSNHNNSQFSNSISQDDKLNIDNTEIAG